MLSLNSQQILFKEIIFKFLSMNNLDRNIVQKYIQICKKYNLNEIRQIGNGNMIVENTDDKNVIEYINNLNKLDYIYDFYYSMKGGKGGKGKSKSKSKPKKQKKQKKKKKDKESDDGDDFEDSEEPGQSEEISDSDQSRVKSEDKKSKKKSKKKSNWMSSLFGVGNSDSEDDKKKEKPPTIPSAVSTDATVTQMMNDTTRKVTSNIEGEFEASNSKLSTLLNKKISDEITSGLAVTDSKLSILLDEKITNILKKMNISNGQQNEEE